MVLPVPPALVQPVQAVADILVAYGQFEECGRGRLKAAKLIGKLLCEQKEKTPRGEWIPWVEANCSFGCRRATDFMRVYQERAKCRGAATFEDALKMIQDSDDEPSNRKAPSDLKSDASTDGDGESEEISSESSGEIGEEAPGETSGKPSDGTETSNGKPKRKPKPPASSQPADPIQEGIDELQKFCHAVDRLKAHFKEVFEEGIWRRFVHVDSIVNQLEAARKAAWQSRPTEACNCLKHSETPIPQCKACFGTGKTPLCRVLGRR